MTFDLYGLIKLLTYEIWAKNGKDMQFENLTTEHV